MAAERLVLCGGVPARGTDGGTPLALNIYGPDPSIHFRLEEVRRGLWGDLPPVLRDLLDVAAYVYTADQALPRAAGGRADGNEIGAGWRRALRFRVPVRVPDLWNSGPVHGALVSALSFLSEDTYEFEFVPLRRDTSLAGFIAFSGDPFGGTIGDVVLFSGGLDSLAGAVTEAVAGRRVLLLNHRSNEKVLPRHRELLGVLARHAGPAAPVHVPVRLNKVKRYTREHTQRTRSFLFAALGAVFARVLGLDRIRFYENGVVSLNLPLATQVVGARASRTTHPRTLAGFRDLFSALLGRPFGVENPFLWDTKTDVVTRIAGAGCADLIGYSNSCAHTWERTNEHTHCGVCSQCIDRRFGVLGAGQERHDPAENYAVDLLTGARRPGESRTMIAAYLELVHRIGRMGEAEFRTQFGELTRILPHLELPVAPGAARVFELYRRHARQVSNTITRAIAAHAAALQHRELPRNCVLRLALDEGGAGAEPAPEVPPPVPGRPEGNYFVRLKRFWAVRYGSARENIYPGERGFDYLRVLLTHPEVTFTASELAARVAGDRAHAPRAASAGEALEGGIGLGAAARGEDALDGDAVDALEARLREIRGLRQLTLDHTDPDRVDDDDELETEERRIAEHLRRARTITGRSRKLGDQGERVRKRVGNAITRALALIGDDDPALAGHLKKPVLTTGGTLVYRPGSETTWSTGE